MLVEFLLLLYGIKDHNLIFFVLNLNNLFILVEVELSPSSSTWRRFLILRFENNYWLYCTLYK